MLATSRRCVDRVKTHILCKVRVLLAGLNAVTENCMLAMNLTQSLRFRSNLFTAMVIMAAFCLFIKPAHGFAAQKPDQISAAPTSATPESIEAQLKQLDSPSFKDREAATDELIERGAEILKPLSIYFFNSSSEAGWRIHRILEGIGKNAEEKDFLKSIAIIQLLYGAQDPQSQARLAKLQYQWKATRRTEAAKKLDKLGFVFVANGSGTAIRDAALERARIEVMVRAAGGGVEITKIAPNTAGTENPEANKPATSEWVNPRDDRQKSILQVEKIINGTDDKNREIVKSLFTPSFQITLPPGDLLVPKGWEFDDESLELIQDLSTLSSLTLQEQNIDRKLQAFISQQKLISTLALINCKFEKDSDKLSLPRSISHLRFEGSLPPPKSFGSLGQVSSLKLSKIKLEEDVAYALSKRQIQMLELEEVEFTRKGIQSLVNMRGLFRISMSLCKFELDWLADIRKRNPNMIVAAPKAFLGVQAPPTDRSGLQLKKCLISQVVKDTAASRAGMQDLDVVTAMDGTKISTFEDLRLMISQKHPGESMQLEILRDNKKLKLKVNLGELNPSPSLP